MHQQGNSSLLQDIHKGFKLKSAKHLSNDRSSPTVKGSGPARRISKADFAPVVARPLLNDFQVENPKSHSNGPFQNKFGMNNQGHPLRPSVSNSNISSSYKPPILRPKPKILPSTSALNISGNDLNPSSTTDTRNAFARLSLINGSQATPRSTEAAARSSIESFATMKRSHGKKFIQQTPDFYPERPRSNSFQQNRLVISSLFGNGSTSQVDSRKGSLVIGDEVDGDYEMHYNPIEPKITNQKIIYPHVNASNRSSDYLPAAKQSVANNYVPSVKQPVNNSYAPITKHLLTNSYTPITKQQPNSNYIPTVKQSVNDSYATRSLRPLPPLPSKPPPQREKNNVWSHPINFEERFRFHTEKDFPKPISFARHRKFYQSSSSKNPANQHHHNSRTTPLVTTV